jgi:hypothetical protein
MHILIHKKTNTNLKQGDVENSNCVFGTLMCHLSLSLGFAQKRPLMIQVTWLGDRGR